MVRRGAGGGTRSCVLLAFFLLGFGAAVVLAAGAHAETGAPALELDGVWRARGDWSIAEGETVVHADERVEAWANVSLAANATLSFVNSTVSFLGGSLRAAEGALLAVRNSSASGTGGFTIDLQGAVFDGDTFTLRFEGGASGPAAVKVADGAVALTDCEVQTDAPLALEAIASRVETLDCDFANLTGSSADLVVQGRGDHIFDTTRFETLHVRDQPSVRLYATVRFFAFAPGGAPAAAVVNGSGVFGELFTVETAPSSTAAVRVLWFRDDALEANITEGESRGPAPLYFTAFNQSVGGNSTSAWITHHRENITVVLDGPFDLGLVPLRIAGRGLDGPPLKRAYYMELGEDVGLVIQVENRGAQASPPAQVVITRRNLDPSSWTPRGEAEAVQTFDIPALAPSTSWNATLVLHADDYGGTIHSTTPCTQTESHTSEFRAELHVGVAGDFASWNDARQFDALVYSVTSVPGSECFTPNDVALPALGVTFVALIATAAGMSYYFSERRVARRAARATRDAKPPPPPP